MAKEITNALVQCVKTNKPEEPSTEKPEEAVTSLFANEMTYDTTDTIAKALNSLIEKTKCSLDVLQEMLDGTELGDAYKKVRTDVEAILENDVKHCQQTEGVVGQLK